MAEQNGVVRGPRAIDFVRKAFHGAGRQCEKVSEWPIDDAGTPMEIFYSPMTADDYDSIQRWAPEGGTLSSRDFNILVVVTKARDEHGQPLFSTGDRIALAQEGFWFVITRLAAKMVGPWADASVEDAKRILGDDNGLYFEVALAEHLHKTIDEIRAMPLHHQTLFAAYLALKHEQSSAS